MLFSWFRSPAVRIVDIPYIAGVALIGRGALGQFMVLISPAPRPASEPASIIWDIGFIVLGIGAIKIGSMISPRGLYRTGSDLDWNYCIGRVIANAREFKSESSELPAVTPMKPKVPEIDIQYHW